MGYSIMECQAIILAAGKGTRMKSQLPKVLHCLAGRPLLTHVMDVAEHMGSGSPIVIIGHEADQIRAKFAHTAAQWVQQKEQLGTGHAVQQALHYINDDAMVLILYGDVPLILPETLRAFVAHVGQASMGVLTFRADDPTGYGRIIQDGSGGISAIIEEKDASSQERLINECNSGIYLARGSLLKHLLPALSKDNVQQEYLLTDLVALANAENERVVSFVVPEPEEVSGINDRAQLAVLERYYQQRQASKLMRAGTTLADPARFDLRGRLTVGRDVFIDVNVIVEGEVFIGDEVHIGANCILRDVSIERGTAVLPFTYIDGGEIGPECQIGPFARVRPGSSFASGVKVGNFVETKKTMVGKNSKINHLSYVGDATLGERVNVGAGTITCNYDGVNKHKTQIENDVFVGSNSALVAPVRLGAGSTIAAGSTIDSDAPAGKLTLARSRQKTHETWQRPEKPK